MFKYKAYRVKYYNIKREQVKNIIMMIRKKKKKYKPAIRGISQHWHKNINKICKISIRTLIDFFLKNIIKTTDNTLHVPTYWIAYEVN